MINQLFMWFWTTMIFASIAWYAILLFYVGWHGGHEIFQMTKSLTARNSEETEE